MFLMHSQLPPAKQVLWYFQRRDGLYVTFATLFHLLLVYNYLSEQQYPIAHDELSSNFQYHLPDHELGHFSDEIRHPFYEPPKLAFAAQHPQHHINPIKSLKDKFLRLFMKHKQSEYYPASVGTSTIVFFFFRNIWKHLSEESTYCAEGNQDS